MGGGIIMKKKIYNTHWLQLTAPFYAILSETSICQFNSFNFFSIMPDKVRVHLTRSETIPSPRISPDALDSQLHDGASSLQFTSLISTGFMSDFFSSNTWIAYWWRPLRQILFWNTIPVPHIINMWDHLSTQCPTVLQDISVNSIPSHSWACITPVEE